MTSPRAVHQVLATLGYGDAIGHEVLGIQRVLREAGVDSEIFVETADPRLEDRTYDYRDLVDASHPENLLLHHFSIGSRASRVAFALPDRMALVYHNITPPEYFVGVHERLVELCWNGRRELTAYVPRCHLALGDSEFNRQELETLGFPRTAVLPVVPGFSHLDGRSDWRVARQFDDERVNILFVGRVIPNKRIEDLIRIVDAYQRQFNRQARLLVVGAHGGFEAYLAMLHGLASTLGCRDIHFAGHVSNEELTAYYQVADVFLCASEHEGFCVPLVEAFHMGLPVIARAATAVPATMDGGGVLYDVTHPPYVAALVDAVVSDAGLTDRILAAQGAALARLEARDFAGIVLRFVEQIAGQPALPPPAVTFDFWDQFSAYERLEELRMYRPGIFKAGGGAAWQRAMRQPQGSPDGGGTAPVPPGALP